MENPIKLIYKFNKEAGFLSKPMNPWLESAFQVEEAIEGFDLSHLDPSLLEGSEGGTNHKVIARNILGHQNKDDPLTAVEVLDKSCDAVVFAVGTMAKLGLTSNGIIEALNIVMQANLQKLKSPVYDAAGKLMKDPSFVGPEEKLKELLKRFDL